MDPSGNYIEKSFALSTIIWAMSRIKKQVDKSMAYSLSDEDFREDEAEQAVTDLQEIGSCIKGNSSDQQSPNPVTSEYIFSIYQEVYKKNLKDSIGDDQEYFCLLCFQAYIDEETLQTI